MPVSFAVLSIPSSPDIPAKSVPENQIAVHTFAASETVAWSISGGPDAARFSINATSGALFFVSASDFEVPTDVGTNNVYNLIVTATDAANNASAQSVAVTVTDLDELAPTITGPSGAAGDAASAKSVPENQTAVHIFAASESVTWSISGGADSTSFSIDPTTGELTFVSAPDFEVPTDAGTNNVYLVIIQAADGTGNVSQQTVTVTVADVVEDISGPVITGPSGQSNQQSLSVAEGGTAVTTFTADEGVAWSITGGPDESRFALDPGTGTLTFVVAPDFGAPADSDANNVYIVRITASDAAGNVTEITLTVTVTDTGGPAISGPSGAPGAEVSAQTVNEGMTTILTFTADRPVTWTLTAGLDADDFVIDPATGVLAFVSLPDHEAPTDSDGNNIYVVVVTATDANGNASQQTLTVTVLDLLDTPIEPDRSDELVAIITDVEINHLRASVASTQDMVRAVRDRFIDGQRQRTRCRELADDPINKAYRNDDACSSLATRNDVPFDVDGTLELVNRGMNGAGTFFGQSGNYEGTRRRIISGDFQIVNDGQGTQTLALTARVAWDRLLSEHLMLGYFLGCTYGKSDIDQGLSGAVDKKTVSLGVYAVSEPVDNLYLEGFASVGVGQNDFALGDDELEYRGGYSTRSFLVGGTVSG